MERRRADLGFSDASLESDLLAGFDPAEWQPDPARRPVPAAEDTRLVAVRTGFQSREAGQGGAARVAAAPQVAAAPEAEAEVPKPRRRRTGRNAQFNLKARPDTIAAFCAVADRQGWGLGETLEHAVALLQRDYPA